MVDTEVLKAIVECAQMAKAHTSSNEGVYIKAGRHVEQLACDVNILATAVELLANTVIELDMRLDKLERK